MNTPAPIRDMTRADIAQVVLLERRVFPLPWSVQTFSEELSEPSRSYLLAESDGRVLGYGGLLLVDEDAHVTSLAVSPEARGARLGTRLLLALVERALDRGARHLTLEVRASNDSAQRLYARFGFSAAGMRKNYYRDEDALVMWAIDVDTDEYAALLAEVRGLLEEVET